VYIISGILYVNQVIIAGYLPVRFVTFIAG